MNDEQSKLGKRETNGNNEFAANKLANTSADATEAGTEKSASAPVLYDYIHLNVSESGFHEIADCYEKLGYAQVSGSNGQPSSHALTLRRDRKIKNKAQLDRLRVRLEDSIEGIRVYEKAKTQIATVAAVLIAVAGTLIFGGGMSLCMLFTSFAYLLIGCILGLAGAAVCWLAYVVYKKIKAKKTIEMNELIEKKRDAIALLLEEGQKYL